MKLAYLIIAHNEPTHFRRLVRALQSEDVMFFVHVDAKVPLTSFYLPEKPDNVHFIQNRIKVYHSGFSLTRSMILLLKEAAGFGPFDYYQFLSGLDYPIQCNEAISRYLQQAPQCNYMNHYPLVHGANLVQNVEHYHFMDLIKRSPHWLQYPLAAVQRFINKVLPARKFIKDLIPYRGSQWFCITHETVLYILDFLNRPEARDFMRYFKWVKASDEIFFQTIVFNSYLKDRCPEQGTGMKLNRNEDKAYLHYIDWDLSRKDLTVLYLDDLPRLADSPFLYARKFHPLKSAELLEALDQQRARQHAQLVCAGLD